MKSRNILYIGGALILGTAMTACHDDYDMGRGEGRLMISAAVNSEVTVVSRADGDEAIPTNDELIANTLIWISNSKGLLHKYNGPAEFPAEGLPMTTGSYVAEGWTGDSVPASFTSRYFTGRQEFDITSGTTTPVTLTCKIANTAVTVAFDPMVDEVLKDYTMTVALNDGIDGHCLTYDASETRRGYFMRNSRTTGLNWTLHGTKMDGTEYTRTGTIENPQRAVDYKLNVKYTGSNVELGGGYFTIEVDESTMDIVDDVIIALAPDIIVVNPANPSEHFNLSEPYYAEGGNIGGIDFFIEASANLIDVVLESNAFTHFSMPEDYSIIGMTDDVKLQLEKIGVTSVSIVDAEKETSSLRVKFSEEFMNALPEGEYRFDITATDDKENNNTSRATFSMIVSNASVKVSPVDPEGVYTNRATLSGSILKDGADEYGFLYREAAVSRADGEWKRVKAEVSGREMTAQLADLTPGTAYEYTVYAITGGVEETGSDIQRFTTELAQQLPNAGFENWSGTSPLLLYADGEEKYWDSGNHGSSTMGKNVTEKGTEYKHSGEYSVKLASQFVGVGALGKFAAGNLFIGEYLETLGTNGALGWGRPFSSRPKALKGWVKYSPVAITSTSKHEDAAEYVKGDMDKGIIYIALVDDTKKDYSSSKVNASYPTIVNTKTVELFHKDDPNVIAYGEQIWTAATPGDGLIEFEIPIEYFKTTKVSNIIIVCSASKGGDYFAGGDGSTMWIDDLELVY